MQLIFFFLPASIFRFTLKKNNKDDVTVHNCPKKFVKTCGRNFCSVRLQKKKKWNRKKGWKEIRRFHAAGELLPTLFSSPRSERMKGFKKNMIFFSFFLHLPWGVHFFFLFLFDVYLWSFLLNCPMFFFFFLGKIRQWTMLWEN